MENKNRKSSSKWPWIIFLLIIAFGAYYLYQNHFSSAFSNSKGLADSLKAKKDSSKIDSNMLKAVTPQEGEDSIKIIRVSEQSDLGVDYKIDNQAGRSVKRIFTGRRINIALIGVDSRLGTGCKHADANHILSILVDSGAIEITSIPRDTPADAGMSDSSGQNKLTIVYALKGREAYFKEAAAIAGLDKIHYYAEVSFSQAMGILELLGIKDSGSGLQVLRSRTALGGDDFQRCYNQGQFIGQSIRKHFSKLNGAFQELLIRGALAITETNLNTQTAKNIIEKLNNKGFAKDPSRISYRVRPLIGREFKIYDFTDAKTFKALSKKIEYVNDANGLHSDSVPSDSIRKKINWRPNVAPRLKSLISKAASDSARNPQRVIASLKVYFAQHAWLQVPNLAERDRIRTDFGNLLYNAYVKKKDMKSAENVKRIIEDEKKIFNSDALKN